jgi:hypothetical protein
MPMLSRRCTKNWPWFGGEINNTEGSTGVQGYICMYVCNASLTLLYIHVQRYTVPGYCRSRSCTTRATFATRVVTGTTSRYYRCTYM